MKRDEFVAVGKSLMWFLAVVIGPTLVITLIISAVSDVTFRGVLIWTSIAAFVAIVLWYRAMRVPKNKGE